MRRGVVVSWLAGIASLVALFWATRIVLPGQKFAGDVFDLHHYVYPHYEATYAWLAHGVLPLWTPYELAGLPWLADPQGGVFYPPHALYLILPTHLALAASGLSHLVWIALSTAWFARRVGLNAGPAALAAVLFVLRGTLPQELLLAPSRLEAAAWLPLGCLAVLDLARATELEDRRATARAGAVLALAAAMSCLAGYPQSTAFLGYAWTSLLVAVLLGTRTPLARWVSSGSVFGIALVLGALVALVQLLPSLELSRAGARTTGTLALAQMFPMGSPLSAIVREAISGSWRSFGVVGLSLVSAALFARRHRLVTVWAMGLGGVAFLFALGPITPLFDLYLHLPALGWFRAPYRLLMVTDFCFAVLAAIGLGGIATAVEAARHEKAAGAPVAPWQRVRTLATIGLPTIVALVLSMQRGAHGKYLAASLAGCVALVLLMGALRAAGRGLVVLALVFLATLETFLAPPNRSRLPYRAADAAEYRTHETVFRTLAEAAGHDRVWLLRAGFAPRASEKLPSVYGFRSFTSKSPSTLARQASYYTYLSEGTTRSARPNWVFQGDVDVETKLQGRPPAVARRRLVDLAAVRFVVTRRGGLWPGPVKDFITTAGLRPTSLAEGELAVFENPHALPRAYVVYRVRAAPDAEELLGRLSREDFDPLVESYVEGPPGFVPAADVPPRGAAATIVRDDLRVVEIDAALEAPGLLVLADSYYEGWRATVDGGPVRIVPTNHLFRGVAVPAGHHRIRFEYRPWSFVGGAVGTLAASLALAVVFVCTHSRRARDA